MNNNLKNALAILGSLLGLLLIAFVGLLIRNTWPQQVDISKIRTINMTAEGKVSAQPDTASASFSVVTSGKTAAEVQKTNDQKMATVIAYLKTFGIETKDIQTSNYNLYPQYDYSKPTSIEQQTIVGYTLNQNVTVKVRKLDQAGQLVGGLTGKGVNQIDALSYFIDDPDAIKAQAREQAIQKAKAKAQDLANSLGVKLGKVVNFSENTGYPGPIPYAADTKAIGFGGGGSVPSPVQPGSQDVIVDVNVTFELN
jgi:uncharacterized protein YggE